MDAVELLESQHKEALALCKKLSKSAPGAERKENFTKLQTALLAHMVIEEEIFYPALAKVMKKGEPIIEAYEEHVGARGTLERCAAALKDEEIFQVRIEVLQELLEHHIEEEREDLFPKAKKAIGEETLEELGVEMKARCEAAKKGASPSDELDQMSTERESQAMAGGAPA